VHVRVEVDQIAESLDEEDQPSESTAYERRLLNLPIRRSRQCALRFGAWRREPRTQALCAGAPLSFRIVHTLTAC
jgi:hypothetical protein